MHIYITSLNELKCSPVLTKMGQLNLVYWIRSWNPIPPAWRCNLCHICVETGSWQFQAREWMGFNHPACISWVCIGTVPLGLWQNFVSALYGKIIISSSNSFIFEDSRWLLSWWGPRKNIFCKKWQNHLNHSRAKFMVSVHRYSWNLGIYTNICWRFLCRAGVGFLLLIGRLKIKLWWRPVPAIISCLCYNDMMPSWHGKVFHIISPLFMRRIFHWLMGSLDKSLQCRAFMFSVLLTWTSCWTNSQLAGKLSCNDTDVTSL